MSDIPLGAVITKAFVSLKFRMIENYNASANRLFIDQHVQIRENTPGAWKYAIKLAEDQFSIAGNTREKGLQIDGSIDVSDIVQGNGTYEFRLGSAQSAVAGLELNDVEIGLRIQSGT